MVAIGLGAVVCILQAYALLYLLYLWAPALAALEAALRPRRSATPDLTGERGFAILVSAHNEEAVIGALLRSVEQQHYPATRRRVYVVANNCTDATAAVVNHSGAAVCHERNTGDAATKGVALRWLWERVAEDAFDCDCVLVLDADNLIAPDFLVEMNRVFDAGYGVVQSARCAKNADDTLTSQLDAISEALWNRLDQAGRARLGLSATIAGSGMAFDRQVFEWLVGDGPPGLLEDIEWQARLMLAGVDVGYAPQARVYDEKTRRATQLSRQRRRWVAGVAIAARTYGGRMLASGIRTRNPRQLIAGFAVTKPPRSVLLLLMAALALGGWLFPGAPGLLPWPFWTAALGSFGLYVLLGMALDGARPRAYLALLAAPVFAAMMIGTSAAGALRASKQQWIPTTHERGIGLDQLRSQ